uniref:Retrovirus-related Pol polyprotein from transposon TNT 1-94-like beta-barrel domain-containing protein n=1 Tax=Nicotiana tabacum TaxID=4097 RepID=A0A1S4DRH9_TOBAC
MTTTSSSRTTPIPAMAPAEKSGKFFGVDFKRWQQKIFFYLTTLSLQHFISEDVPVLGEETPENERFMVTKAWKHFYFLCKNYILSCLEDDLYNVYSIMKTSRELWNALEKKYKTKDAGLKKFVAAKFLDFKMVDAFQVAAFSEKLPPLWKDFKNYLKHKRKEMTLEDLIVRLRIEEDNKAAEKKSRENSIIMVGHKATECRAPKKDKKKSQVNMIEKNDEIDDLCAMLSECNLVGNPREWWIDSGATRHVCANKELFTSYAPAGPNETVFMANSATANTEGTCKITLKMTSGKIVILNDVLHVPEIRKNLVSTSLLVKNDF